MQSSSTEQKQSKRQINWIGIILLNVFVAQIVFSAVKRLQELPLDRRMISKRYINPVMLKIAGRRPFPQAIIHHLGRKSGQSYATPVAVVPIEHGFAIPLAYGTNVDWCRNILATGNCTLQWHDATYNLVEPEISEAASVIVQFLPVQQVIFRMLKIEYVLTMQLSTASVDYMPTTK
jgi:deazaflavin-dependent oxidoreductase (nitroreductase family)